MLFSIKLLHTAIWAVLAGSILGLPVLAGLRRFRWTLVLTVLVVLECGVLAFNGGRCPLPDLAAKFTAERTIISTSTCLAGSPDAIRPFWHFVRGRRVGCARMLVVKKSMASRVA